MTQIKTFLSIIGLLLGLFSSAQNHYKCLVQMTNYQGEAAYIVVSLINPKQNYEKTLYVMGDDNQWYDNLENWFGFYEKEQPNIDAITGASITGGTRRILSLDIDSNLLDKGYWIRFESVVEDMNYYKTDVQIPFSSEKIFEKTQGTGYIRYVKFNPIKE